MSIQIDAVPESPTSKAMRVINEAIERQGDIDRQTPPPDGDEDRDSPASPTPQVPRKRAHDSDWRDLTSQAQALAKEKRLRPSSTADLSRFARARDDERSLYLFMVALENRDRADDQAESADWKLPKTLKTNCVKYTTACLLSPTLPSYKLHFAPIVLKLIKALDVEHPGSSQLPSGKNAGQLVLVTAEISSIVVKKRSELKAKIQKSVANKDCIERLCENITTPLQITPTTLLYARIAFLRCQLTSYPDLADEKFWAHIDNKLKTMRTAYNTKDKMKIAMDHFLTQDRAAYKNGEDVQYQFADPFAVSDWQQAADAAIGAIVPEAIDASSTAPTTPSTQPQQLSTASGASA